MTWSLGSLAWPSARPAFAHQLCYLPRALGYCRSRVIYEPLIIHTHRRRNLSHAATSSALATHCSQPPFCHLGCTALVSTACVLRTLESATSSNSPSLEPSAVGPSLCLLQPARLPACPPANARSTAWQHTVAQHWQHLGFIFHLTGRAVSLRLQVQRQLTNHGTSL